MTYDNVDKEFNYAIQILDKTEACVDHNGSYNHDIIGYARDLVQLTRAYSLLLLRLKEGRNIFD